MTVIAFPTKPEPALEPTAEPVWFGVSFTYSGADKPQVVMRSSGDIKSATNCRLIAQALREIADSLEPPCPK